MKRKQLLALAALILAACMVVGCGKKTSGPEQTEASEDANTSAESITDPADDPEDDTQTAVEAQEASAEPQEESGEAQEAAAESEQEEAQEASTEAAEAEEGTQLANPWKESETAWEAGEDAGVGYFMIPYDGTMTGIGPLNWYGFRYMENLAEADGAIGAADLTVRKGLRQESEDVSGDYNEYAFAWDQSADGWDVHCFGNEEGKAMKAIWLSDNFSYSIMVRGQGDIADTFGLEAADVELLVSEIQ